MTEGKVRGEDEISGDHRPTHPTPHKPSNLAGEARRARRSPTSRPDQLTNPTG
ncbi:hypothetical protein [Thermogemmatispora onikobensis]|uniref:hypothetical protein n=1 Tax=Thermogemmatispora onikobensis TaxID=732234 RepID=UPI00159F0091|nr:hypothetical protein [Thermogemmatispora onikobensis]